MSELHELPEVLSVAQVAAELRLTDRAVRHRIKVGTLRAIKTGPGTAAYVVPRSEVERVLAESKRTSA